MIGLVDLSKTLKDTLSDEAAAIVIKAVKGILAVHSESIKDESNCWNDG